MTGLGTNFPNLALLATTETPNTRLSAKRGPKVYKNQRCRYTNFYYLAVGG